MRTRNGIISALTLLVGLSLIWLPVPPAIAQIRAGQHRSAPSSADYKPGAVVDQVAPNSEGEKAGLKEGDIFLRWVRGNAKGEIESPFDLSLIEIEQAPRGSVTLEGLRGAEKRAWVLAPADWGLKTRPNLTPNLLSLYTEGQQFP